MTTSLLYIIQAKFIDFFGIFQRVNRSEHGGGSNEFTDIWEYEHENSYIPNGN